MEKDVGEREGEGRHVRLRHKCRDEKKKRRKPGRQRERETVMI